MQRCDGCHNKFPNSLVKDFSCNNKTVQICGVCALRFMNFVDGKAPFTPFQKVKDQRFYEKCKKYREKQALAVSVKGTDIKHG